MKMLNSLLDWLRREQKDESTKPIKKISTTIFLPNVEGVQIPEPEESFPCPMLEGAETTLKDCQLCKCKNLRNGKCTLQPLKTEFDII